MKDAASWSWVVSHSWALLRLVQFLKHSRLMSLEISADLDLDLRISTMPVGEAQRSGDAEVIGK